MATALVTGASSGIGEALARLLAAKGHTVVLAARRLERMQKIAAEIGGGAMAIESDLADPAGPQKLFDEMRSRGLAIDILVNNAGFGAFGHFIDLPADRQMEMITVNISALTHLAHLFIPQMVSRGWGRVMNVASTAAFQPGPRMAVYFATKAYVLSLSEALAFELRPKGVTVTALCPGPTHSEFQQAANMEKSKLMEGVIMTSEEVAEAGYRGMMQGKSVVIPGLKNRLLAEVSKVTPHAASLPMIEYMQMGRK